MYNLFIFLVLGAFVLFSVAPLADAAQNKRCPSIERLEEISKSQQRQIALTAKAFQLTDCTSSDTPSLDSLMADHILLESRIFDWWILHTPSEDIELISQLVEKNRKILETSLLTSKETIKDADAFGFWGISLDGLVQAAVLQYHLTFRIYGERANFNYIRLAAVHEFQGKNNDFCLGGLAVLLASNGIVLKKMDGDVAVYPPNRSLQRTR